MSNNLPETCQKCGSSNIIKKGTYMNSKGEMQTRQCTDCGKTKSEVIKNV